MEFTFLETALILGIFTHAPPPPPPPPPLKTRPQLLAITPYAKGNSLRQYSLENLFPPTAERGGGNYDFLYQNLVRKYEDDLEH